MFNIMVFKILLQILRVHGMLLVLDLYECGQYFERRARIAKRGQFNFKEHVRNASRARARSEWSHDRAISRNIFFQ